MGDVKEVLKAELKMHRAELDAHLGKMQAKIDRIGETFKCWPITRAEFMPSK